MQRTLLLWVAVGLFISLRTSAGADLSFDSQGQLLRDGQPTFPVGLYVVEEPRFLPEKRSEMLARLDDIAHSPFKLLVDYGNIFGPADKRREVLDEMHERGLSCFVSLEGIYPDRWLAQGQYLGGQSLESAVPALIDPVKDHPAIVGWYVCDEYPTPEPVANASRVVRKNDPSRPILVCSNHRTTEKLAPFADAADILAVDDYPVPRHSVARVADTMKATAAAAKTKPYWAIIQGCGGYVYKEELREHGKKLSIREVCGNHRLPTTREMRAMTYLAVTENVKGVLFYYYRDYQLAYDAKDRWTAVKSTAAELNQLSPVLLAPAATEDIRCDEPSLKFCVKKADGVRYLIAVNSSTEVQSSVLTLSSPAAKTELMIGSGLAYAKDNELLLTLDGYEAVVVKLD